MNYKFKTIQKLSYEMFRLPSGETRFIDEKRFGGNGMLAWDLSGGKCKICGCTKNLCLHHANGFSNELDDLVVLCRKCHRLEEIKSGR